MLASLLDDKAFSRRDDLSCFRTLGVVNEALFLLDAGTLEFISNLKVLDPHSMCSTNVSALQSGGGGGLSASLCVNK